MARFVTGEKAAPARPARVVRLTQESAQARVDAILDMTSDAFVEVNSKGLITGWNLQAERLFGWRRSEAVGHKVGCLAVPPSLQKVCEQALHNAFHTTRISSTRLETTALHRDGHEFPVELVVFPTSWEGGRRLAAFARDLSLRKTAEREEEKTHQMIMDQLGEAYSETEMSGTFTFLNRAYCEVFHLSKSERLGVNYKTIVSPEHLRLFRETYRNVRQTGKSARFEYPITLTNGKSFFVEQSVSLRRNAEGEPVGFLVMMRDVTELKQTQRELAQAKDAAEAASRAKSEFLANVSHEIRTPLNGVIGMLELTHSTQLTPEQKELLGMAYDSANSLLAVINDILDFSKIEAGKIEFDSTEFDLRETVAAAVGAVASRARQKHLRLECDVGPEVPALLLGDPARLKQVLMNLLGNAIKFTEQGRVALAVAVESLSGDKACLQFTISDTGIGIPPESQKLIFEAFSQADASTTRKYGGTGLGLAICSRIVTLLGGNIWVESEAGKGSTFHFTAEFPLCRGKDVGRRIQSQDASVMMDEVPAIMASASGASNSSEPNQGLTILVAEDNLVNRSVAVRLLEKSGHKVVVARDGREVLAKLQEQSFDLVLMDVQMPEMDGLAATMAIREKERGSQSRMPIVAMTAHAMNSDRELCLKTGMDDYIAKPINSSKLNQTIKRVMQMRELAE